MSNYTSIHVNHFRYLDKTDHGQNEPRLRTKWTTFQDKNGPGFRIKRTMFLDKMGPVLGNYSINSYSEPLEIWYETFRSGLFPSLFIYSPEGPEMPCGRGIRVRK